VGLKFKKEHFPFQLRGRSLQGPFGPYNPFDPCDPHSPFDPYSGGLLAPKPKNTRNSKTGIHLHTPCKYHCVKGLHGLLLL